MPNSRTTLRTSCAAALPPYMFEYLQQQGDGDTAVGLRNIIRHAIVMGLEAEIDFLILNYDARELHRRAEERVLETPQLCRNRALIMADQPDGAQHLAWIICAPVEELEGWIKATKRRQKLQA